MTEYNQIATFGGVHFFLSEPRISNKPSTLKTNIGKTYVSTEIPYRNPTALDKVIQISGVITGQSRTAGQSQSEAIEADRTALLDLEDGFKREYSDGRNSGNFVIQTGTLTFNDSPSREHGEPFRFVMTLEEWQ